MMRLSASVITLTLATGACACGVKSNSEPNDTVAQKYNEHIGINELGVDTFDIPFTTTQQGNGIDNSLLSVDTGITKAVGNGGGGDAGTDGGSGDSNVGFCWFTRLSGSFRGMGEYAKIDFAGSTFKLFLRSNTVYDGVANAGPGAALGCLRLKSMLSTLATSDFVTDFYDITARWSTAGWNGYDEETVDVPFVATSTDMWPLSGVEGKVHSFATTPFLHDGVGARRLNVPNKFGAKEDNFCAWTDKSGCQVHGTAWSLHGYNVNWTYSVLNVHSDDNGDVPLINAGGQKCFIDGIEGYWAKDSNAQVVIVSDGKWHLQTSKGSVDGHIRAYASCFPLAQGF